MFPDDQSKTMGTYQQLAMASEWMVYFYLIDNVHIKDSQGASEITIDAANRFRFNQSVLQNDII